MKLLFIIFILIFSSIFNITWSLHISDIKKEYQQEQLKKEDLFRKIIDIEKQQKKLLHEENQLLSKIHNIEQDISNMTTNIIKTENNLKQIQQTITTMEYEVQERLSRFSRTEERLSKRVNTYIKYNIKNDFNISNNVVFYLGKDDISNDLLNKKIMEKLLVLENDNISKILFEKNIIELSNKRIIEEKKELENQNEILKTQLNDLQKKKAQQDYYFTQINKDATKATLIIEEYKNQQEIISRVLTELENKMQLFEMETAETRLNFENKKNNLPYPVKHIKIVNRFGTNRLGMYNNIKVINNGIDFFIDNKTNIYSVSNGNILFADYFHGYGNMIIIDHGDGYRTIYSNIDEITVRPGEKVRQSQIVGIIRGDINAKNLHFELRHFGTPVNPANWFIN